MVVDVQRQIEVDPEACIHCGGCYSLCPVDAIGFQCDRRVVFDVEKCVACGLCVDSCPTQAIRL